MKNLRLGFFMILGIAGLTSCYEYPEPGIAKIIVLDANDDRVPSANVILYQPGHLGTGYIYAEGVTDQNGEFSYVCKHPQAKQGLEVILDVTATDGMNLGQGTLRVKPGETATLEIKIY